MQDFYNNGQVQPAPGDIPLAGMPGMDRPLDQTQGSLADMLANVSHLRLSCAFAAGRLALSGSIPLYDWFTLDRTRNGSGAGGPPRHPARRARGQY